MQKVCRDIRAFDVGSGYDIKLRILWDSAKVIDGVPLKSFFSVFFCNCHKTGITVIIYGQNLPLLAVSSIPLPPHINKKIAIR